MKICAFLIMALAWALGLTGCTAGWSCAESGASARAEGNARSLRVPYGEISGGWTAEDRTYRYCLELNGRLPGAKGYTTFVVLSNDLDVTFDEAYRASELSGVGGELPLEAAVVVEVR